VPGKPAAPKRVDGEPRASRAEVRRQTICEAVLELLAEVGYDRMSMDAVAERAHAGKATIYRRWPNKAAMVMTALSYCSPGPSDAGTSSDTGTLRGDLLAFGLNSTRELPAELVATLPGLGRAMRDDPELAALVRQQLDSSLRQAQHDIVRRAISRGEIDGHVNADLIGEVAIGMALNRMLLEGNPIDEEFAFHLVDDILLPLLGYKQQSR
jgi:AcrR family transcriptional regulator